MSQSAQQRADYSYTEQTVPATRQLIGDISADMAVFKELAKVPADKTRNFRNDMYLVSETLRLFDKSGQPQIVGADKPVLKNYKKHIDNATKFIPGWVKVAVAIALGLGTMVGWKRIVATVGAWVMTLPASILLAGTLFWLFSKIS